MTINAVAFYLIAALIVGAALAVVAVRTIIHAAFALVGCFFMVGALYLAAGADFLAIAQLLIYAGAIPVLIIFAIMLTRDSMGTEGNRLVRQWPLGVAAALGVAALLIGVFRVSTDVWFSGAYADQLLGDEGTTKTLGAVLVNQYSVPFEAASVLLLVALVGAIVLGRRDQREAEHERAVDAKRERVARAQRRREDRERARQARTGVAGAVSGEQGPA